MLQDESSSVHKAKNIIPERRWKRGKEVTMTALIIEKKGLSCGQKPERNSQTGNRRRYSGELESVGLRDLEKTRSRNEGPRSGEEGRHKRVRLNLDFRRGVVDNVVSKEDQGRKSGAWSMVDEREKAGGQLDYGFISGSR
jgi:hypothetical protein